MTKLRALKDWIEISTPFVDRHNDFIQIYARRVNGHIVLTDDGHTLTDLEQGGFKLTSPKRQDLLNMTLRGFGVQCKDGSLSVESTPDLFALRKHNLIQAILAVNDLFYLASLNNNNPS